MPRRPDPYGDDVLAPAVQARVAYPEVAGRAGMTVVHRSSGVRGRLVRLEVDAAVVRTEIGTDRLVSRSPGAFLVDGQAVTLVPVVAPSAGPVRTASGSIAPASRRARVARAGRIWVEGVHDAELVERVWGDDLREEGIVVERLDGIDCLADAVRRFGPSPSARLGVLVDHLVAGSKESRLAAAIRDDSVLVTGTPFVDVWQAIRPAAAGIPEWPEVPLGIPWKEGVCAALGVADPRQMWRRLLASVRSYADLEPALVGAVERLVDFVTSGQEVGPDRVDVAG